MTTDPFDTSLTMTTEPESLLIGSYQAWRRLLDYSSDTFSLAYRLTPIGGGTVRTVSGTFDDTTDWWVFTVGVSDMTGWDAGSYRWDLRLTRLSDSEVMDLSTGILQIYGTSEDRRTHAEIMVQKIESLLSGRADHDVESYSIKSRQITKMSAAELRQWRDYYVAEVARSGGSSNGVPAPKKNTVRVRWI